MTKIDLNDVIESMAIALFVDVQADIIPVVHPASWGELAPGARESWRRRARAALGAGMPGLRELFARLVEGGGDRCYKDWGGDSARAAYRDAAQAVRTVIFPHPLYDRSHIDDAAQSELHAPFLDLDPVKVCAAAEELATMLVGVDVAGAQRRLATSFAVRYPHAPCSIDGDHGPHLWGGDVQYCAGRGPNAVPTDPATANG